MTATAAAEAGPARLEVGTWTRPWTAFGLEAAIEHAKATGFRDFGLMTAGLRPDGRGSRYVIEPEHDDAHVNRVGELVRASGLRLAIVLIRTRLHTIEEAIASMRRSIGRARQLGARFLLSAGTSRSEDYETFFAAMRGVMDHAGEAGVDIVMKPHGGLSATAADCVAACERIDSPHFGICWDPGNVWAYTKTPPEEGFAAVAPYVRAVCLKDSPRPDQERPARVGVWNPGGSWSVRPGLGRVDWRYHFTVLRDHGFSGPCLIETLPGDTLEEIDAAAVATRRYFEDLFATLRV
ncbi:MAG: sugar phosphate isomerase/epimerase [Chloroflexi bacterium]|nr:sugar phosphate isomerase/epimerase [Chloroflexota bacterium]